MNKKKQSSFENIMKVTSDMVIYTFFYVVLISVIVVQFNKVFNSQTTFEEYELSNGTKLPSFTLCPYLSSISIETFKEAMIAIDNAKGDYSMKLNLYRPFEEG